MNGIEIAESAAYMAHHDHFFVDHRGVM